eukprot:CAMPEP_0197870758 /NCGR_PEP_ID=MMETSP1439-20131203/1338_1 /TAXON_ID=66791 /ORGANISM="Gonyaulax spinifera, Strain CCMP409" /LENGTH=146 /DNA_ID=CAMNT_0043489659 /DNA_START=27 /DNA_END=464 /DNA_ORIENTATION=-
MRVTKELANVGALAASEAPAALPSAAPALPERGSSDETKADRGRGKDDGKAKGKGKGKSDGGKAKKEPREPRDRSKQIPIETEGADPAFPWKDRLIGIDAGNMNHVKKSTGVRVWCHGTPGEDMHLRLSPGGDVSDAAIQKATEMC